MGTIPFKKLGVFLGASLVVIVSFLWVAGGGVWKTENKNNGQEIALGEEVERERVIETDTDGDGLKDWEETLWKTDPNNGDTDGDGTLDGDEIDEGRDPNIPGPEDEIKLKENEEKKTSTTIARSFFDDPSLNTTEAFSRDFFSQYISLRDRNLPSNVQGSLYQGIINDAQIQIQPANYTTRDLKIINSDNEETNRAYAESVAKIISEHSSYTSFNEPTILQNALINRDPSGLSQFIEMSKVYENLANDLLAVTVPISQTNFHLTLVNNYATMASSVYKMADAFNDPIGTMFALKLANESAISLVNTFENIRAQARQ